VVIKQTVLEEGAMAGLSSVAEFDNVTGVLHVNSQWDDNHASDKSFPDMYGGPISMYNCPMSEITITVPADMAATKSNKCTMQEKATGCSLFNPSLTVQMHEPTYECSFKNPQACPIFGGLIIMSVELESTIDIKMADNETDVVAWPASDCGNSATDSHTWSRTVGKVTRSYDDCKIFPGQVTNFNSVSASIGEGTINIKNVKANTISAAAEGGILNMETTKAAFTNVAIKGGEANLKQSAIPRFCGEPCQRSINGVLTLRSTGDGGKFEVDGLLGGSLLAQPGDSGSVDAKIALDAFQGTVRLAGSSQALTAPDDFRHDQPSTDWATLTAFIGTRMGCNASDDSDCTFQILNVTEGKSEVTVSSASPLP
jgi:hypothetical protein